MWFLFQCLRSPDNSDGTGEYIIAFEKVAAPEKISFKERCQKLFFMCTFEAIMKFVKRTLM